MGSMNIVHSVYLDEENVTELKQRAAEGNLDARIELATLEIEEAHDVEKNLAFLEDLAQKDNTRALMNLYFIYQGEVTRTKADGSETVLIFEDQDKAEEYLKRAADLGSAWAMSGLGIRARLKRLTCDEKDLTAQHFLDEEKWYRAAVEASQRLENDLLPFAVLQNMQELISLYEDENPKNPLRDAKKAAEWKAKAAELEKELGVISRAEERKARVAAAKERIAKAKAEYAKNVRR